MTGFTLSRPHPDHVPSVGRVGAGRTTQGALKYATTLKCSCGWFPTGGPSGVVAMSSPANGGKSAASHAYRRHLVAEGIE